MWQGYGIALLLDGLCFVSLLWIPLWDVQLLQLACNLCNFNAIIPITLQSFVVLQSNCNRVWLCRLDWTGWIAQAIGNDWLNWRPETTGGLHRLWIWVVIAVQIAWKSLWSGLGLCITMDFGSVSSIALQSFALLRSNRNPVRLCWLRSIAIGLPWICNSFAIPRIAKDCAGIAKVSGGPHSDPWPIANGCRFWVQLGMSSRNLWICQDFGEILEIPWQSFAISQSHRN